VTVGDMDVAVEPIWIYSRRVTVETMAMNNSVNWLWGISFLVG